jgi:hypothetical protein
MQRQILPPHSHPADSEAYLAACSPEEKQLVELAIEQLGSSYFMEKSHGYLAWKKTVAVASIDIEKKPQPK